MEVREVVQICAFIPLYQTGEGLGTQIFYRDGQTGVVSISTKAFMARMTKVFALDLKESRRNLVPLFGQKILMPLILTPFHVYVPIKVRKPLIPGDPAYGYFRLRSILEVGDEEEACTLILEGGHKLALCQSMRIVRARLKKARTLESHLLEGFYQLLTD